MINEIDVLYFSNHAPTREVEVSNFVVHGSGKLAPTREVKCRINCKLLSFSVLCGVRLFVFFLKFFVRFVSYFVEFPYRREESKK